MYGFQQVGRAVRAVIKALCTCCASRKSDIKFPGKDEELPDYIYDEATCDVLLEPVKKGPVGLDAEFESTPTTPGLMTPSYQTAVPRELARILESAFIVKVGVDFANDTKCFGQLFANPLLNFQCVGVMTRYANTHMYAGGKGPLSLVQCVRDTLHANMDKTPATQRLENAQGALKVFNVVTEWVRRREKSNGFPMPPHWFTHDIRGSERTM
ncbi:hypothetical protein B0H14DRAFT_2564340 [Mycena olivaceomarginata]|nr:hypothetical protein B0H14DRAFT_2564340 [Mycena olivaceomarginata]